MLFGVCRGDKDVDTLEFIKEIGFSYVECGFGWLSKMSDDEFEEYKNNLKLAGIPCLAANCFLPGEYKVSSNNYDKNAVSAYIENGMRRGAQIGLKTIVFGSGGARQLDETQSYRNGFLNIGEFLKTIVKPLCEKYNIRLVIEPLCKAECNIINTVKEGAMLSSLGCSDNIGVLADIYHMVKSNDEMSNITDLKGCLYHAHISYPYGKGDLKRCYPEENGYDYKSFVNALRDAGCETCSIEASTEKFKEDAEKAVKVLKSLI